MGYPEHEDAVEILKGKQMSHVEKVEKILTLEELRQIKDIAEKVFVHDDIFEYMNSITSDICSSRVPFGKVYV